jgi:hypothetical protein
MDKILEWMTDPILSTGGCRLRKGNKPEMFHSIGWQRAILRYILE